MDFVETVANLDQAPQLHVARLLLLLEAFAEDEGTIEGLTKLAKLDVSVYHLSGCLRDIAGHSAGWTSTSVGPLRRRLRILEVISAIVRHQQRGVRLRVGIAEDVGKHDPGVEAHLFAGA